MAPLLDYAHDKPYYRVINANSDLKSSLAEVAGHMEPETVLIRGDVEGKFLNFLTDQGYIYLDIHHAMTAVCHRLTPKGQEVIKHIEMGQIPPAQLLIQILQDFIYSGRTFGRKFVLGGQYPCKVRQLDFLEKNCGKIDRMYYITSEPLETPIEYCERQVIETALFNENRFSRIPESSDFADVLENIIQRR